MTETSIVRAEIEQFASPRRQLVGPRRPRGDAAQAQSRAAPVHPRPDQPALASRRDAACAPLEGKTRARRRLRRGAARRAPCPAWRRGDGDRCGRRAHRRGERTCRGARPRDRLSRRRGRGPGRLSSTSSPAWRWSSMSRTRAHSSRSLAARLAPGGLLILSTPNRTAWSRLLTITLAEGFRRVPRGTHDFAKFITPDELTAMISDVGPRGHRRRRHRLHAAQGPAPQRRYQPQLSGGGDQGLTSRRLRGEILVDRSDDLRAIADR